MAEWPLKEQLKYEKRFVNQMTGIRIKNCRKEKNITVKHLADVLLCTEATMRNYEAGRTKVPPLTHVYMAGYLGVDIEEIRWDSKRIETLKKQISDSKKIKKTKGDEK
ncbi:MAG: Helix-turn-helix domain protein [bacterium ADurb.Bin236]|nr:MAG: Helix-turn-helix domain protein [bacterium ADurb.Bin236]